MSFHIGKYKNIEKKEYNIEVITPMFLAGANNKEPELRAPSIKGMLRFWWRALHPDLVINGNNYIKLKEYESKIFGDSGKQFGKSKVRIILSHFNSMKIKDFRPTTKNFTFKGIENGQRFSLIIFAPEDIHYLVKFSFIVGGVGKRARRGFGSMQILNNENNINVDYLLYLIQKINKNNIFVKNNNKIEISNNYNCNYPFIKEIEIGESYSSSTNLIEVIKKSAHDNDSFYTGFVFKKKRFASPIYVSVFKSSNDYHPVITTLNSVPPISIKGKNTILNFKKDIL